MRTASFKPVFVKAIPERVDEATLYISQEYGTAVHKCACGCGIEVVTPLGATGWNVTHSNGIATLHPSIGNWAFPCRSHYWIRANSVLWAEQWSEAKIAAARAQERAEKIRHFDGPMTQPSQPGFWARLWRWFMGN
jgi:hypothetical protein